MFGHFVELGLGLAGFVRHLGSKEGRKNYKQLCYYVI